MHYYAQALNDFSFFRKAPDMSNSLSFTYEQLLECLGAYIEEQARNATDTTHGYLKKEAALRADGAFRCVRNLIFEGAPYNEQWRANAERHNKDLLPLQKKIADISVSDER